MTHFHPRFWTANLAFAICFLYEAASALPPCYHPAPSNIELTLGGGGVVCVGGSVTLTLSAWDVDAVDDPRDCYDTLSFSGWPGTATRLEDGTYYSNWEHTYNECGVHTYNVTASDGNTCCEDGNDPDVADSVTVYVIGGPFTATTHELRYYCGALVPNAYKATLTAKPGQPPGVTYTWTVVSGPAQIVGSGSSVVLEATGMSFFPNDILVMLVYELNGQTCTAVDTFTSLAPAATKLVDVDHVAVGNGYASIYYYILVNQLSDDPMPDVDLNEVLGETQADWPETNWVHGREACAHIGDGGGMTDTHSVSGLGWWPEPQNPQDPLGNQRVIHFSQDYFAGTCTRGQGCHVGATTVYKYRDHAQK